MGRKKKNQSEIEEKTDVIDLEEMDLDLDDDGEEASELELEDFDEEATVELELEEAKPKKTAKKSKKKAKKKSSKKAKAAEEEVEAIEPDSLSDEASPIEISLESPRQEATLVAGAMQQSMESMAKQWTMVKDTTEHVSKNFERVSGMLGELPIAYDRMLQEMAKQHQAKPPKGVKAALVASLVALVLSGISLLYSQSVRQTVLDKPVAAAVNSLKAKVARPAEIAKRPEPPTSDLSEFTEATAKKKAEVAESRKNRKSVAKKRRSSRRR
ncbi:MAG: hypothetical protein H6617_04110 [Bdellovibrionaceae bacterium]|nr:hypothetical protein [Bdellovibrionales bacterium]MCB9253843.1 hypothetical protein [Pseudobdellovibrionaceae bacterium]